MPSQGTLRDRTSADFRLIETLGYLPGEGAARAGLHAARMERSASAFGFPFEHRAFDEKVARLAEGETPLRLRVTLDASGMLDASAVPFVPSPVDAVWRIAVGAVRADRNNPLNLHKTSIRDVYERARAEFPASEVDDVILLNEDDEICEGTITNVFVDMGGEVLLTPSLTSGVLPGVLRSAMMAERKAEPATLRPEDLRQAKALYVGNSLRGLIRARLV